jgi:hypothetical protein
MNELHTIIIINWSHVKFVMNLQLHDLEKKKKEK